MKVLRKLRDNRGMSTVGSLFLLLAFVLVAQVLYAAGIVYTRFTAAQTELERAGSVAVDRNMTDENVRDLDLAVPPAVTQADLKTNLLNTGWEKDGNTWQRVRDGKLLYELDGLSATVSEGWMYITADYSMPLPWRIGGETSLTLPISVQSKVLYLD